MKLNVLITGVGGQGTLLASRVLGNYAGAMDYDCKLSEVHGMAQRGGSVVTQVKFGDKVYSPLIADGDADVLLAFEELEALRSVHMVKQGGTVIVNTQRIMPLPVMTGAVQYPQNIIEKLSAYPVTVAAAPALTIAESLGNVRVANTVMLGLLAKVLQFDYNKFKQSLIECVPEKAVHINLEALEKGYQL